MLNAQDGDQDRTGEEQEGAPHLQGSQEQQDESHDLSQEVEDDGNGRGVRLLRGMLLGVHEDSPWTDTWGVQTRRLRAFPLPVKTSFPQNKTTSCEIALWSGRPDSNWRPLAPHASALPTAPRPDTGLTRR